MNEYVAKCDCGYSVRASTPREGWANISRHIKGAHEGKPRGATVVLEGFEWVPSLDAFQRALREREER